MKILFSILMLVSFAGCAVEAGGQRAAVEHRTSKAEAAVVVAPAARIAVALTNFDIYWAPSQDTNAEGYRVYWGLAPGVYIDRLELGNVTNATLTVPLTGQPYHIAVTAWNRAGAESDGYVLTLARIDAAPKSSELVLSMPLAFDLFFPNPGTALQASRDLKRWAARVGWLANGVWRVVATAGVRTEFYRTVTTK